MIWDASRRRYIDDYGRVIPEREIRKHVNDWIEAEREEIIEEAEKVALGTLTIAAFFSLLEDKVRSWHEVAGTIAFGGESQMTPERWDIIDQRVVSELEYLAGFKQDAVVMESISGRAAMYVDSAYSTYANSVTIRERDAGVTLGRRRSEEDTASCEECIAAADDYFKPLDDIPEIGSLQCLHNCRCTIEYAEPPFVASLTVDESEGESLPA